MRPTLRWPGRLHSDNISDHRWVRLLTNKLDSALGTASVRNQEAVIALLKLKRKVRAEHHYLSWLLR